MQQLLTDAWAPSPTRCKAFWPTAEQNRKRSPSLSAQPRMMMAGLLTPGGGGVLEEAAPKPEAEPPDSAEVVVPPLPAVDLRLARPPGPEDLRPAEAKFLGRPPKAAGRRRFCPNAFTAPRGPT